MKYTQRSFTVPAIGEGKREGCLHGWVSRGRCVLCGEPWVATSRVKLETTDEQIEMARTCWDEPKKSGTQRVSITIGEEG